MVVKIGRLQTRIEENFTSWKRYIYRTSYGKGKSWYGEFIVTIGLDQSLVQSWIHDNNMFLLEI